MESTSPTLLEQLKTPTDAVAWKRFVSLYTPLLYGWARQLGLQDEDAADLLQDVFLLLYQKLPEFDYDKNKSFRGWLRTVTQNKWHDAHRKRALKTVALERDMAQREEQAATVFEAAEYRQHLVNRALQLMRSDFHESTWRACWEVVVNERPADEVAKQLGISANAVYLARSRVIVRLKEQLKGLLS